MRANSSSRISFSWAHPSGLRQKHAAEASSIPIVPVQKLKPFGASRLLFNGPDIFVGAFKSTSKSQHEQVCSNPAASSVIHEAD
jgi:hypothetical protein